MRKLTFSEKYISRIFPFYLLYLYLYATIVTLDVSISVM